MLEKNKVRVFVLNQYGEAIIPCTLAKAQRLLLNHQAQQVSSDPLAIQLCKDGSGCLPPLILRLNPGCASNSVTALIEKKEVFTEEMLLSGTVQHEQPTGHAYTHSSKQRKANHLKHNGSSYNCNNRVPHLHHQQQGCLHHQERSQLTQQLAPAPSTAKC